jgi:hypothetical protein
MLSVDQVHGRLPQTRVVRGRAPVMMNRASVTAAANTQKTYGEYLVLDGLACCFEEEIGGPTPFYATECKGAEL